MHSAFARPTFFYFFAALALTFCALNSSLRADDSGKNNPAEAFQLIVVPTTQYAYEDIWNKTPNGRGPAFSAVERVVREQQVRFVVLAVNYAISTDSNAEANYRVSFRKPDGSAGSQTETLRLIPRQPATNGRLIRKAADVIGFAVSKTEPLGEWTAVVEATDVVGNATARVEKKITVASDEMLATPLPTDVDPARWMITYYQKPAPHQLIPIIERLAKNPPTGARTQRLSVNGSWLGFFEQVMKDNPWLRPHVVARLENSTGAERELIASALAYATRDDPSFVKSLSKKTANALTEQKSMRWPIPAKEPLSGAQLDVLWGRFFASGRYEPIRELVSVLAYHPYLSAVENHKKSGNKSQPSSPEFLKGTVFGALAWSLTSNIQQDKVVRDYCEGILIRKELPEKEHVFLAAIFTKAVEGLKKGAAEKSATPQKI